MRTNNLQKMSMPSPNYMLHCTLSGRAASIGHQRLDDNQFLEMELAFSASGGIAHSEEVVQRLRKAVEQPISLVARWIVDRRVVSFVWQSQTWLPMFQFDMSTATLHPGVAEVMEELVSAFDDWDVAMWFVRPNAWLGDSMPVSVIDSDVRAVLDAARVDRFIAHG